MDQVEQWLPHFQREQFLFVLSERFYADPSAALRQVTDFLGIDPLPPQSAGKFEKHNLASYEEMAPEVRTELAAFYRPHNQRLTEFLGEDPGWGR